jgi:hypothetical protein
MIHAVEKAVPVEPVGEFALKGIRHPMMTYNVLETHPRNRTDVCFWHKADIPMRSADVRFQG